MLYKFRRGLAVVAGALVLAACAAAPATPKARQAETANAQSQIDKAVAVIGQMRQQPTLDALLRDAKGLLVVPEYGRAAGIAGGREGVGVMAEQASRGAWSHPAFLTIGGLSIGVPAGGEPGAIAYVLMTPRAIAPFETRTNKFALVADAGLTIVNFSSDARIASSKPTADVVVWTDIKGLFAGAAFGATDVVADAALNEVYYRGLVSPRQILIGAVHNHQADNFDRALTMEVAGSSSPPAAS
jgi:lipid-binding SYLF domain-containing protein